MFLRTERLFLRPAWREDAPELARTIGQEPIVRMLSRVPWPYREEHALGWIEAPKTSHLPTLLVTLPERGGRIVGGCGLHEALTGEAGEIEVGYWIAPEHWGRGYATEALGGLLSLARLAGHRRIVGRHAADNPASGRVLRKVGFRPTGRVRAFHSLGRKARVEAPEYALDLADADGPQGVAMRKAA
jgi:RimJ/RimL family protein N-acetyltransferase